MDRTAYMYKISHGRTHVYFENDAWFRIAPTEIETIKDRVRETKDLTIGDNQLDVEGYCDVLRSAKQLTTFALEGKIIGLDNLTETIQSVSLVLLNDDDFKEAARWVMIKPRAIELKLSFKYLDVSDTYMTDLVNWIMDNTAMQEITMLGLYSYKSTYRALVALMHHPTLRVRYGTVDSVLSNHVSEEKRAPRQLLYRQATCLVDLTTLPKDLLYTFISTWMGFSLY